MVAGIAMAESFGANGDDSSIVGAVVQKIVLLLELKRTICHSFD